MWTLAHEQGIALPVKDYWDFEGLISVADPRGVAGLPELDAIYQWTELIQSSPLAVERSVHSAIGGAYRRQNITTLELRFNPMKRNRGGERDLDHIILAAIRGLDRAELEYPQVRAGLIVMMDRTFSLDLNAIVVEKAIRWAPRGIVGDRHRRTPPRRGPLPLRDAGAARRGGARRRPRGHDPRRRGGRPGRTGRDRRGDRGAAPRPHRPRHPRRDRRGDDAGAARARHRARDLPDIESAHEGALGRGGAARHGANVRRPRAFASRSRRTARR